MLPHGGGIAALECCQCPPAEPLRSARCGDFKNIVSGDQPSAHGRKPAAWQYRGPTTSIVIRRSPPIPDIGKPKEREFSPQGGCWRVSQYPIIWLAKEPGSPGSTQTPCTARVARLKPAGCRRHKKPPQAVGSPRRCIFRLGDVRSWPLCRFATQLESWATREGAMHPGHEEADFERLQGPHSNCRFSHIVRPPRAFGTI